jgi:hypothetical protein
MENLDYPELKPLLLDVFFQEELMVLYFYSVRSCPENLVLLEKRIDQVLQMLEIHFTKYDHFIDLFYNLVLYIRKTGEHDLTYMMIWKWYHYFPFLAKQLIKECLNWRDVIYFCHYVSCHMKNNKVLGEAMIEYCVRVINKQFISDMETWRFSIHAGSREHISNVAKWIPRENKRFSWLYELLVLDWIKYACPYLLQTTTRSHSYEAAILKGKRLYRKKVATLNKALQTVQIKQCSKQLSDISPKVISKHTSIKQPKLMERIKENKDYSSSREPDLFLQKRHSYPLPISYFIKEALTGSISIHDQWHTFSKMYSLNDKKNIEHMLPILDISDKIQSESNDTYYNAIGLALLICEHTSTMRILAIGENPIWISLDPNMTFIERVNLIHEKCSGFHCSQPNKLNDLIQNYILETSSTILPTLVFLSDYSTTNFNMFVIDDSCRYDYIHWNLSSKYKFENIESMILPGSIFQSNIKFISGYSFSSSIFQDSKNCYELVCKILENC